MKMFPIFRYFFLTQVRRIVELNPQAYSTDDETANTYISAS